MITSIKTLVKALKMLNNSLVFTIFIFVVTTSSLLGQSVIGTISRPDLTPNSVAVYETDNKVFIADNTTGKLYGYDGVTHAELSSIYVGGTVSSMIVHEQSGKLYAASHIERKIAVINAATGAFITYLSGTYTNYPELVLDASLGKIYALSLEGLTQIDVTTNTETSIPGFGGGGYEDMALNPVTHELFVTRFIQDALIIVDGVTLMKTSVDGLGGLGIGVNWIENKAYISKGTAGSGVVSYKIYDRDTGSISSLIDVNDAIELVFNPISNRMYTDSEVNALSTIIAGISDGYFNLPMFSSTTVLSLREATNHIYYVGRYFIGVLDDATQLLELIPIDNPLSGSNRGIAINQTTGRVYVINNSNLNFVTVVQDSEILNRPPVHLGSIGFPAKLHLMDPVSHQVMDSWTPPSSWQGDHATAVRPGGGRLYVPHVSSFTEALQIYAGAGNKALLTSFGTGGNDSRAIAFLPDGSRFYVTNSATDNVSVVDAATNSVITMISVSDMPWGIAVTPDGSKAYIANQNINNVFIINTVSNMVTNTIAVGNSPWGVTINPGGTKAYIANSGNGTVSVIDVGSETVINTIDVGSNPHWIAIAPDGKHAYVSNRNDGTVSVIDTGIDTVTQTITVGPNPEGIDILPDGSEVFVANSIPSGPSTVSVINIADYSVTIITLPSDAKATTSLAIENPTSKFAGRVISGTMPINGALVRALQDGEEKGTTTTNASGDYSVYNLKAGTYDLEVSASGYVTQTLSNQTVGIGRTTLLNFELIPNALPSISVEDVSITEGNTGTVNAIFTVTLSAASGQQVTVDYSSADGTATAGDDFIPISETVIFSAGDTVEIITVPVNGDIIQEADETFFVNLSNPINAIIDDGQGQCTIIDDDLTSVVVAQASCLQSFIHNCPISIAIIIDVSETSPEQLLGSYNATLTWDPALLEYTGYSGGDSPFNNPTVNETNTGAGELQFAQFDPAGAGGEVNVIHVNFNIIGDPGLSDTLDLNFSEIVSAVTLNNLLPITTIEDCSFEIEQGCLLGDVTGEEECSIFDALIIATYDVGLEIPPEYLDRINQGCGNVTGAIEGDEETTIFDALIIATSDVGLPVDPYVVCEPHCPD